MLSDIKGKIAHELHKPARKNFPRRRVKVLSIGDLLQADLVEMIPYAKDNKGYKYLLTLIDCFSKKGYAAPVKDKTAKNVKNAMESILPDNVRNLQTDEGKEFFNKDFSELTKKRKINHYHTYTHLKASIVERFKRKNKFKVGDPVRISKYKHIFAKGYQPSWTTEVFTIDKVKDTKPPTYLLKDENNQVIVGGFYEQELLKTPYKDYFLVEKVLRRKNGKSYVKWLGFPSSANSWIDDKDLV